jgi:DNA invertase Pin-like site-specific DNA recombinase
VGQNIIEMNKVAIYSRISNKSQDLYNQKMKLAAYAHERNWIFDMYEETESTRNTRPTKQELLNQIRLGVKYDAILIYSFDRWARNYNELIQDIHELMNRGIKFISVGDGLDISTESGKESLKLLTAFYKFELDKITERTKLGLERAKMEGKILGRPMGSKDKTKRKTIGYIEREEIKRNNLLVKKL